MTPTRPETDAKTRPPAPEIALTFTFTDWAAI